MPVTRWGGWWRISFAKTDAIDDDWMGEALEGVPVERAV
jgi:hypothetical protein